MMEAEFGNGYRLELAHYPDRKKPVMVLSDGDGYVAHAVFKDDSSMESFAEFFKSLWGDFDQTP